MKFAVSIENKDITKDQEKALIKDFYAALPKDSYLKTILKGLPEYCDEQISNDWGINPLETLENITSEYATARAVSRDRITGLQQEVKDMEGIAITERDSSVKWQNLAAELKDQLKDVVAERNRLSEKAAQAEYEILQLKSKLYDYLTQGAK